MTCTEDIIGLVILLPLLIENRSLQQEWQHPCIPSLVAQFFEECYISMFLSLTL